MKYQIISVAKFGPGAVLGLNEKQAAARSHVLKKTDRKGFYETTGPVEFKIGEVIGYEGDLSKTLATLMVEEEKAKPSKKAKAAAATESQAPAPDAKPSE